MNSSWRNWALVAIQIKGRLQAWLCAPTYIMRCFVFDPFFSFIGKNLLYENEDLVILSIHTYSLKSGAETESSAQRKKKMSEINFQTWAGGGFVPYFDQGASGMRASEMPHFSLFWLEWLHYASSFFAHNRIEFASRENKVVYGHFNLALGQAFCTYAPSENWVL